MKPGFCEWFNSGPTGMGGAFLHQLGVWTVLLYMPIGEWLQ
jgi:hypothetical protein